jgi:hypothetical protein
VQIGFNLPISGTISAPEIVARIAREGETMGYDDLTPIDHVVLPDTKSAGYPCSETGKFFGEAGR